MLILAYTDALGFNLHQLCQRVHEAATDGYGSTYCHIVFRKFFAGNLRGRVDGCTVFAYHEYLKLAIVSLAGDESFGFTTGCTVADGNGFDGVLFHQLGELAGSYALFALGRMRINGFVVQQVALCIEAYHLTAGTISWVDAHHPFLSQRWSQQQLTEVSGKDTDGFFVGFLLAEGSKFGLDAGFQQALVGIVDSLLDLLAAFVVATYVASFKAFGTFFVIGRDGYLQKSFGFASADRQQAVRGTSLQRFAEVEIILVLDCFLFLAFHHLGRDDGLTGKLVAELVTGTFVFAHLFGDDVPGSFQCIVFVLHVAFNKGTYASHEVVFALHHEDGCQWFQPLLTGSFGAGFPFRLIG